jgi:hypothetical protein
MNENPAEAQSTDAYRSTCIAYFVTVIGALFWIYYLRITGNTFVGDVYPLDAFGYFTSLIYSGLVSGPGIALLYNILRGNPEKGIAIWFLIQVLFLITYLFIFGVMFTSHEMTGVVTVLFPVVAVPIMASIIVTSLAMTLFHWLRQVSFVFLAAGLIAVVIYPSYGIVKIVPVKYSHQFRGGVSDNVEYHFIFLVQALKNRDISFCKRYRATGRETGWKGCTNVMRLVSGEPLLPFSDKDDWFGGWFRDIDNFINPGSPHAHYGYTMVDGVKKIFEIEFRDRIGRDWIRSYAPEWGCDVFKGDFLQQECEAFMTLDPNLCLTAECVTDIAVQTQDLSLCDTIDRERHEPVIPSKYGRRGGHRKPYVGICYTLAELSKEGVIKPAILSPTESDR